jgi:hypothetical protein
MKTRMMRKIAVLVTGSTLALSLPVASSVANQGGAERRRRKRQDMQAKGKGHHEVHQLAPEPSSR